MKRISLGLNGFYVLSISLHIMVSLFFTNYFIQIPSFLKEVLIAPAIGLYFTLSAFKGRLRVEAVPAIYVLVLLFYSIVGLINGAPDSFAIRYYLFPVIIFFIIKFCLNEVSREQILWLLYGYMGIIVFVGAYELIVNFSAIKEMLSFGDILLNLKIGRAYLFFKIPNLAGLALSALILFFYLYSTRSSIKTIVLALGFVVLIYVFARTSILALIISIVLYEILCAGRMARMLILTIIALVCIDLFDYIKIDEALIMRLGSWAEETLQLINGLGTGIGFVTVNEMAGDYVVFDSDVLRMLYEIGLVGLISFLVFIFYYPIKTRDIKSFVFCCFIIINMTMGDFHSMYPGVAISYICLALLLTRNQSKQSLRTLKS